MILPQIGERTWLDGRARTGEQGDALRLVSGATMHLLSVALCVTCAPVYEAAGCALTVRRAAERAEDRPSLVLANLQRSRHASASAIQRATSPGPAPSLHIVRHEQTGYVWRLLCRKGGFLPNVAVIRSCFSSRYERGVRRDGVRRSYQRRHQAPGIRVRSTQGRRRLVGVALSGPQKRGMGALHRPKRAQSCPAGVPEHAELPGCANHRRARFYELSCVRRNPRLVDQPARACSHSARVHCGPRRDRQ
jgi:hypothetical protein